MRLNKQLLTLSGILLLGIIINLIIIFYWIISCSLADTQIERFFYCDAKEGPSLSFHLLFIFSSGVLALHALVFLISSFFVRNSIKSWIKVTILIIFSVVFISPFFLLIKMNRDVPITLSKYELEREKRRANADQVQKEWLESEEYENLQEDARQRSCDMAKDSLKNWKEGEPLPLLPVGCN